MVYKRWWYLCNKCGKLGTVVMAQTSIVVYIPPIIRCEYCGHDEYCGYELTLKDLPPEEVSGDD